VDDDDPDLWDPPVCDACGAHRYWITWICLTELRWCNHHFRKYESELRKLADAVIDRTWEMEQ